MIVNYNYLYNNKIEFSLINQIPIKINVNEIKDIHTFFLHLEYPKREIIVSYLNKGKHINLCNLNTNNTFISVICQILSNDIYQYICRYDLVKKNYDNINANLILNLNIYLNHNYLTRIFSEDKIPKFIYIIFNLDNITKQSLNKLPNLSILLSHFETEPLKMDLPQLVKSDRLINYQNKLYIYTHNYQKKKCIKNTYCIYGLVLINIQHKYRQLSAFLQNGKTVIFTYKMDIYQWYYQILKQNLKVCYLKTFSDYKKYYSLSKFADYQVIIIAYELLLNPNYRKSILNLPTYKFSRIIYDNLTDYLIDNKQIFIGIQSFQTHFKYIVTNKITYSNRELSEIFSFISNYNKEISIKQLSYFRQLIEKTCFYQGTYNITQHINYKIINLPYSNLDKLIYLYYKRNLYKKPSYLYSPFITLYNYINKNHKKKITTCPICYDNVDNKLIIKTKCHHYFCLNCFFTIINSRNNNCPLCRSLINQDFTLTGKKQSNTDIISQDLKVVTLLDIITKLYQKDNNCKIVIYCRYQNIIGFLKDYFSQHHINCFLTINMWNKCQINPSIVIINNITKLNKITIINNLFILEKQTSYLKERLLKLKQINNPINIIHLDNILH